LNQFALLPPHNFVGQLHRSWKAKGKYPVGLKSPLQLNPRPLCHSCPQDCPVSHDVVCDSSLTLDICLSYETSVIQPALCLWRHIHHLVSPKTPTSGTGFRRQAETPYGSYCSATWSTPTFFLRSHFFPSALSDVFVSS
jgi:hypothetical protein